MIINLSTFNIDEAVDALVTEVNTLFPNKPLAERAEMLGRSSFWFHKKSKELGFEVTTRVRINPEEIYDALDQIEYGQRKVLKQWSVSNVKKYTALYCREQREKVGYEITETKTGVAVKLFLQATSRSR